MLTLHMLLFECQYLPWVYVFKETFTGGEFTKEEQERADEGPVLWVF